ncbi:MAG: ATP-binding protein, partial [Kiritimatiellales bacterium]
MPKSVFARFLCIFLPIAGGILLATWGLYYLQYIKTHQNILRAQEAYAQHLKSEFVQLKIGAIVSDLHVIAYQRQLSDLLSGRHDISYFLDELFQFSKYKGIYDQIRVLDDSGQEIVRIDLRGDLPVLIPKEELQSKRSRYYFKDIFGLDEGDVYMSRFDLNIEHGEIEIPVKPMIRFGMPLFSEAGDRRGVLVLNYLGNELISSMEQLSFNSPGRFMLLDRDGYWLKGADPSEEWGFMIGSRIDQNMKVRYPELWKRISKNDAGQFLTEKGLITFEKVYPLNAGIVSSDGSSIPGGSSTHYLDPQEYFWVILSWIQPGALYPGENDFIYALVGSDIFLLIILGVISWRFIVANEQRRRAEESLRIWNSELEQKVAERTRDLSDANAALKKEVEEHDKSRSEKEKIESQLRQAQKMEAIGALAGGVAHDFNNILTPIIGYAEMILMQMEDDNPQRTRVNEILNAAGRAKELVRQILTFSRRTECELVPLKIQLIIKETLTFLRASLPTTIEIRTDINSFCRAVKADPTQIHQMIMNLCTNAYQSMRDKGGILSISLRETEIGPEDYKTHFQLTPGGYLLLEVSDTGCGIPKEQQEKIFEPYFTTKAANEGTGLGLSLVHAVVKNLRGHITVYSEPGEGTTFRIYLPVMESEESAQPRSAETAVCGGTEHILLVDDEPSIIEVEKGLLEDLGYTITTAADGGEALQTFMDNPDGFDLIVTDLTMPKITGTDLIDKIHACRPDLPAILCTGY